VVMSPELHNEIHRIARALAAEFDGVVSPETIARYAEEAAEGLSCGATVARFLPAFIERVTRERLRALARADSSPPPAR
jgi:Protein-tyrosine-phosphatase-like, N-terminal domain